MECGSSVQHIPARVYRGCFGFLAPGSEHDDNTKPDSVLPPDTIFPPNLLLCVQLILTPINQ